MGLQPRVVHFIQPSRTTNTSGLAPPCCSSAHHSFEQHTNDKHLCRRVQGECRPL